MSLKKLNWKKVISELQGSNERSGIIDYTYILLEKTASLGLIQPRCANVQWGRLKLDDSPWLFEF
jgi:hypothetical protein